MPRCGCTCGQARSKGWSLTAGHIVALMRITHCTALIWGVLPSLDRGIHVPLEETVAHIQDGSLPGWLPGQLDDSGRIDLSLVAEEAWRELMQFFAEQQGPREFSISENGLAYLVALATEGVQQLKGG
jgi:hypothetical protein